jgi:hypothetical protein
MTRRTRLFLAVAGGVLILGIGAGVVASYYGFQGFTLANDEGPDELAYLPQDSTLVAYANVRDVMNSELRRRMLDARPAGRQQPDAEFEARTGINVERDIEMVVASFAGGQGDERPLVVARGTFDEARIEAIILEQGGRVEDYRDERLFILGGDGDTPMAVSFVESGIVAAGTVAAVRRAIDTRATGDASVTANAELMALVRDMDQGTAWAVGRFDSLAQFRLPEEVTARLPPIAWFAATGRVNGGVEALIRAETSTEQGAEDLRQVVQGFLALARLQSGSSPQLSGVVNSLQLGGQGRTVSLSVSVPAELIDLLSAAGRQNDQNNPGPALQP